MKKALQKILALTLGIFCLFSSQALGAPGEVNLFSLDNGEVQVESVTALGEELYFLTYQGLYSWNKTMEEPQLISKEVSPNVDYDPFLELTEEEMTAQYAKTIQHIFTNDGELFGLNKEQGIWYKIVKEQEEWKLEKALELDWDLAQYEEDYGGETYKQPIWITMGFVQENKLFLYGEMHMEESSGIKLIAFDLETGKGEELPAEDIVSIASYASGKIFAIQFDYQKAYEEALRSQTAVEATPVMGTIDLVTHAFEPLDPLPLQNMSGLVYNKDDESVYIAGGGKAWQWKQGEGFKEVNYIPVHSPWQCQPGFLLPGQLYVAVSENYKTYVRSIDPALKAQGFITIRGAYGNDNEIQIFQKLRPEVPLTFDEEYGVAAQDIGQKLIMGDDTVDLYKLSTSAYGYQFLKNKGYVEGLSQSSILTAAVEPMYPAIKDVIQKNGELVAFPVELRIQAMGYIPQVFEILNLEVPKTWKELMEVFAWWGEEVGEGYDGTYYLTNNASFVGENTASKYLFDLMTESYIGHQMLTEGKLRFDTPMFRQLVADLEALRPSIDLIVDPNNERGMGWSDYPPLLLDERTPVNPQGYDIMGATLTPLQLEEGRDTLHSGELTIYILNPNSKNKELAMSFLETLAQNLSREAAISFYPHDNEPVENPYNKQFMEETEERIKKYEERLKTAKEEDRQLIEEEIKMNKESLEAFEKSMHYWDVPPQSIERYRSFDGKWGIGANNPLAVDDQLQQFFTTQKESYLNGEITIDSFINEVDNRIAMIELENQ
ncbi:MAG: extracellular solute-binding protein [Clostridiales bacterium]|nr:extracellular solute-binding protein [Clostridiales bacterium]